eukprot:Lankesteria_metandrocarpae@DN7691_c0_g1_i1.p1
MIEGEGVVYQDNAEVDFNTSGVSWYKYFQMEVTADDISDNGLYTFVGGGIWNGTVNAFGNLHFDSAAPGLSLTFADVTATALYVKPRVSTCSSFTTTERVNVFMMRSGSYSNGMMSIHSTEVVANESDDVSVEFDAISTQNSFISVAIQGSSSKAYLTPQIIEVLATSVKLKVATEMDGSVTGTTNISVMLVVLTGQAVSTQPYYHAYLSSRRVFLLNAEQLLLPTPAVVDISPAEFAAVPFLLVSALTYTTGASTVPRIRTILASRMNVVYTDDACVPNTPVVDETGVALAIGWPVVERMTNRYTVGF